MSEAAEEAIFATESVSIFLSASREQELEALTLHADWIIIFDRLNGAFSGIPSTPISGPALPPLLIAQAHGSFLAAVRMSLAGQIHVSHAVLRSCIEHALYALIMQCEPSTQMTWANRHTDRRACIDAFSANAALVILRRIDSSLAAVFKACYEITIDHGAHPNVLSLLHHLDFGKWDNENSIESAILVPADHHSVGQALNLCAIVGAAVASLCSYVMPAHGPAAEAHEEAMAVLKELCNPVDK